MMAADLVKSNASTTSNAAPGLMLMEMALLAGAMQMALLYFLLALPYAVGYPVAFCFDVTVPAITVLSALSLPVVAATAPIWMRHRWIAFSTMIYVAGVAASTLSNGGDLPNVLTELGRVSIPVALAVAMLRFSGSSFVRDLMIFGFSLIWLLNVIACLIIGNIAGICANQNWVAATTVGTAPFAYTACTRIAEICRNWLFVVPDVATLQQRPRGQSRLFSTVCAVAALLIAVLTGLVVRSTECRASVLAVGGYALIRILEIKSRSIRRIALAVLCCFGIFGVLTLRTELGRVLSDIRIPVWRSTVAMIAAKPVFGHGPDQFCARFMDYRSTAVARNLLDAMANHPHNEPLLVAANLGIPAAVVWLALCWVAVRRERAESGWEAPRMAAILLFGQGLLDLPLDVSPSCIIFPVVLGWGLGERLKSRSTVSSSCSNPTDSRRGHILERALFGCASVAAVAFTAWEIHSEMSSGWAFRRGIALSYAAFTARDRAAARSLHERSYASYNEACQSGSDRLRKKFHAGMTANEELGRSQDGRRHFEQILKVDPQFAFTNYLMGRCDLRDAFDPAADKIQRRACAERAVHFLTREIEIPRSPRACMNS